MANKRFTVSELDFETIKDNLKTYLEGQDQFADYNFAGSSLNILLDVLAYNTHYNSLYHNLSLNESFLDSASKRNSVVSLAKSLGYIPRSAKSSKATITFSVVNPSDTDPVSVTLPKYSKFTTRINSVDYNFYTLESVSVFKNDEGNFIFENLEIYEGVLLNNSSLYTDGLQFTIPNRGVDTDTLTVKLQDPENAGVYTSYKLATSILNVNSESEVYFIKELDNELVQIEFGNGSLGKEPDIGQNIVVEYLVTNKEAPNGAKTFTFGDSVSIGGSYVITTVAAAAGGSDVEDIEEIRFAAPKYYASQNRAVTTDDYSTLIKQQYPNVESINVWGGENNTPPVYGKVFISVKPKESSVLTNEEKTNIIQDILSSRSVVSITPEFTDPEYIKIEVNTTVYYDDTSTSKTSSDIKTSCIASLLDYDDKNLNDFNTVLKFSNLTTFIDNIDNSISSNITKLKLHREFTALYSTNANYTVDIGNPIVQSGVAEENVVSTGFYIEGNNEDIHYMDDDGKSNIRLYTLSGINKVIVSSNIGTVDYETGIINVSGLNISSLASTELKFIVEPSSYDVVAAQNNVVIMDPENLNVTVLVDSSLNGSSEEYTWTNSR